MRPSHDSRSAVTRASSDLRRVACSSRPSSSTLTVEAAATTARSSRKGQSRSAARAATAAVLPRSQVHLRKQLVCHREQQLGRDLGAPFRPCTCVLFVNCPAQSGNSTTKQLLGDGKLLGPQRGQRRVAVLGRGLKGPRSPTSFRRSRTCSASPGRSTRFGARAPVRRSGAGLSRPFVSWRCSGIRPASPVTRGSCSWCTLAVDRWRAVATARACRSFLVPVAAVCPGRATSCRRAVVEEAPTSPFAVA